MESDCEASRAPCPELWAGAECSIIRTGDGSRDKAEETGHRRRRDDVDRIAELGVRTVRFPILWEAIAPDEPGRLDFGWTDDRLAMLRERGIAVIGGLLHHGSGPRYTSLVDPDFASRFADYAAQVADRYPWIETWTPINEPLTTARFSGLYGHWYPHGRDYGCFLRALINQCRATSVAMRAIRARIPGAQLLQTEDLGKTFSTRRLRYQAAHENERRWLSFDLLAGRVDRSHAWHPIFLDHGIGEEELDHFLDGGSAPDLVGLNHYLTSERFLDHRRHLYPGMEPGGNGRDLYVDAEAVRVERLHPHTGLLPRLREAWDRYRRPMAITEVHHGCTRDEQLRWFAEVWEQAQTARNQGMDVRAVTLWSLFGNVDWRSLLTRREGLYDTGAYDVRGEQPRPTVLAQAAAAWAKGGSFDHPVLDIEGWWRRPARLYPWHGGCEDLGGSGRKLLITGATGTLGQAFARICEHRGLPFCLTGRAELDLGDEASTRGAIERHRPWAVINCAGYVRVADAEREPHACFAANADGAGRLARACAEAEIPLVTFSSDLVFDGKAGRAYREDDPVSPACTYGRSKAEAERLVLAAGGRVLVIRTSAFFGPWDRYNFAWHVLAHLARGERFEADPESLVSPTYVPDLCHAALDLLIDGETGIRHLSNQGSISWHGFARRIAEGAGHGPAMVIARSGAARDTSLSSGRGFLLRPLEAAIADYLAFAERPDLAEPTPIAAE